VWLIGWGRANHAGLGDNDVLEAVINESEIPTDNEANVDGNARFYGAEFWYSGSHTMTEAQYKSGILLSCAIVDFHNWSGKSIIGHGEWQPGKWDPGYKSGFMMNMDITRHDINTRLAMGPNPVTTPDPVKPEAKPQAYSDVWKTDAMRAPSTKTSTENPYWEAESMLRYAAEQAAKANAKADKLLKHFGIE
jgi:hypothetical protein